MNILVQGTQAFDDYAVFMRAMAVAMSGFEGGEVVVYSLGPKRVNDFAAQFSNLSEDGMSARGMKIKYLYRPFIWAKRNIKDMDYVAFLANEGMQIPRILKISEDAGVEGGIFRYG